MLKKAALLLALVPALSAAQEPEWLVAPYIWGSSVSWDLAARGDGTLSARDLADKTDGAGLIRIEWARDEWGFALDWVGISLSENSIITAQGAFEPIDINTRVELDVDILELGGFYRPSGNDTGVQYLFGLRRTGTDSTLLLTPPVGPTQRLDDDRDFTDVYVGARFLHRFNDTWDLSLRADYGFGDTDGTLNLLGGVGWRSAGYFGLHLGYRHLAMEFDQNFDGEEATTDIDLTGPFLGFMFRF